MQGNIADIVRINEKIRADQVRLIGPDGEQVGIVDIREALSYADRLNLDLVEVAPMANPPVCKVMDYGKYRYEQEQKAKEARKRQTTISIKEIKLRPKIDDHDFDTKKGHVERFLRKGDKVKLTIMFRGRELVHPHLGERLLRRMADDLVEIGEVESQP
ncbi:MAG TPA: translation initiation factor IF-3, partial [Thermoleophilia bacterium]|nr:translation initiation factor IF-3 [Thermoleophilia bacterium]